jgi:hypothetical protein
MSRRTLIRRNNLLKRLRQPGTLRGSRFLPFTSHVSEIYAPEEKP